MGTMVNINTSMGDYSGTTNVTRLLKIVRAVPR